MFHFFLQCFFAITFAPVSGENVMFEIRAEKRRYSCKVSVIFVKLQSKILSSDTFLLKLPLIIFHENSFSNSPLVSGIRTDGQTDNSARRSSDLLKRLKIESDH